MATPAADEVYRGVTRLFALIVVGFGIAIVAITLVNGGGVTSYGLLIGLVFTALGAARFYLSLRASRD